MNYPTRQSVQGVPIEVADLADSELSDAARQAAATFLMRVGMWNTNGTPEGAIRAQVRQICQRHRIEPPNKQGLSQVFARLCEPAWWRRALRKRFRIVEHVAICSGAVHARAGKYVSDKAMHRATRAKRRIAELLESLVAVNQTTGEMMPLNDLAEKSLSNPKLRRMAMMARIKGVEEHANTKGQVGLFLTITCPSRMHPRHSQSGAANDRYDGTTPRQAQAHLNQVWRHASRALGHSNIDFSGMRVVEPHHDACPHWHALAFVMPSQADTLIATFKDYALRESPGEPGAELHRFKVERIDPAKGSAVGYVAKYVSKSIDGQGVDVDHETGAPGGDAASRIVAWARLWGIRQFQFFGLPPITPTREFYRVGRNQVAAPSLIAAHEAAKQNNYGNWLRAIDGHNLDFTMNYSERKSSRYPDETTNRLIGLGATANDLAIGAIFVTRADEWVIQTRKEEADDAAVCPPWTRINNCAPIDLKGLFHDSMDIGVPEGLKKMGGGSKKSAPRWAPLPNAGRADLRSSGWECSGLTKLRKNPAHARLQGESHA